MDNSSVNPGSDLRALLAGGDRRSVAQSERARSLVRDDLNRIAELASLAKDDDWLVSMRALDLLEKFAHERFGADAWIGTWKLNPAKSKFSPGPAPKGQTVTFSAVEGGKTKVTVDATDADGKFTRSAYVSMFDGKDVPWSGNPNADTAAAKKIDEFSYENQSKKGGKPTLLAKVTVSKDGKTLTVVQTGRDAQGKTVNNTAVYDKQ